MNIYGSLMDIFDQKNKDIYVENIASCAFKKLIHEHLWLIDGHF